MISDDSKHLLYIHPTLPATAEPLIDGVTRRLCAAWRARTETGITYRGMHHCTGCHAPSSNTDYRLGGMETNSLALHYVAYHRAEVPQAELDKIASLPDVEVEPTPVDLAGRSDTQRHPQPKKRVDSYR